MKTIPYRERGMICASCRSAARWMVIPAGAVRGTTTCERHRPTWERRHSDPEDVEVRSHDAV